MADGDRCRDQGQQVMTDSRVREVAAPHLSGRVSVLASADNCTKCGICQTHCPVAAATPLFPGPKTVGPQVQRFRSIGHMAEQTAMLCSGCGICTSVCPNDVAITDIIAITKANVVENGERLPMGQRILNRPDLVGRIGNLLPPLANTALKSRLGRKLAQFLLGISTRAALPHFHGRAFRRWFAEHRQPDGPVIGYFPGCAVEHYEPRVGIAVIRLLNRLGYRVEAPSAACCSLPMLSSGEWRPARGRARNLVDELAPTAGKGVPIVASSTSCSLTLRKKYEAYLDMHDPASRAVADSTIDICAFLRDEAASALRSQLRPMRARALYHGPCQLRSHQAGWPALELLSGIDGLTVEMSRAACCGTAGTYGYSQEKREIAEAVAEPLMAQIQESLPDFVICDSETCRWHIAAETGLPVFHPVEVLLASTEGHRPRADHLETATRDVL